VAGISISSRCGAGKNVGCFDHANAGQSSDFNFGMKTTAWDRWEQFIRGYRAIGRWMLKRLMR